MIRPLALSVTISTIAMAAPCFAFDSRCYQHSDETQPSGYYATDPGAVRCDGFEASRHRWIGPSDEHRQIWEATATLVGLPPMEMTLRVFTSAETVDPSAAPASLPPENNSRSGSSPTLMPTAFSQTKVARTRAYSVGEFAQLPDFGFSFWDWASGQETCPIGSTAEYASPFDCHDFPSHMGATNASHFLPQAGGFFRYYHDLAMARARECKALDDKLKPSPGYPELRVAYVVPCEQEALTLEAIAHHYLHDAWSTGHMFQRWGGPNLNDFQGAGSSSSATDDRRTRAEVIAVVSGMIHGSRGVVEDVASQISMTAIDPLCAPLDPAQYSSDNPINALILRAEPLLKTLNPPEFVANGQTLRGVGDIYAPTLLAGGPYAAQSNRLLECAATSLSEVYQTTAMASGAMTGGVGSVASPSSSFDAFTKACFSQRVTNGSFYLGMGVDGQSLSGNKLVRMTFANSAIAARIAVYMLSRIKGKTHPSAALMAEFRVSLNDLVDNAKKFARSYRDETNFADVDLPDFMSTHRNSEYMHSPPAEYVDPPLPWRGGTGSRSELEATVLARTFHRAHVADWCSTLQQSDLDAIIANAKDSGYKSAQCEACNEVVRRFVAWGSSTSGAISLCRRLDSKSPQINIPDPNNGPCACFTNPQPVPTCTEPGYADGSNRHTVTSLYTAQAGWRPCPIGTYPGVARGSSSGDDPLRDKMAAWSTSSALHDGTPCQDGDMCEVLCCSEHDFQARRGGLYPDWGYTTACDCNHMSNDSTPPPNLGTPATP